MIRVKNAGACRCLLSVPHCLRPAFLKTQELALRTVLLASNLNAQCSEGVVVHVSFVIIVRDIQVVVWLFACICF